MENTKHTPIQFVDDWRANHLGMHCAVTINNTVSIKILLGDMTKTECLSYARLIATAPEMLEALKAAALICAKQTGLSYKDRRAAHEIVLEAIAKAEGRK